MQIQSMPNDVFVPNNCKGLALPTTSGLTIKLMAAISAVARWQAAKELLRSLLSNQDEPESRCLQQILAVLERLTSLSAVHAFGNPMAYFDVPRHSILLGDDMRDSRLPNERALSLVRHIVGLAAAGDFFIVVPDYPSLRKGLYLPACSTPFVIRGNGGPLAIHQNQGLVKFTWYDGISVTLPVGKSITDVKIPDKRLELIGSLDQIKCLNSCPEIVSTIIHFNPIRREHLNSAMVNFIQGKALLAKIWPEANIDVNLFLKGVLFLAFQDHVLSHSPERLHGVVFMTSDSPLKVADVLCHEISHNRMNLFLECDPILLNDHKAQHPSPWRPDLRPLLGILNGVHAFLNVCAFYYRYKETADSPAIANEIYQLQSQKVRRGWEYLQKTAKLTVLGEQLFTDLEQGIETICT